MRTMLREAVQDATLVELVLAIVTGLAVHNLLSVVSFRLVTPDQQGFALPTYQLAASLTVLVAVTLLALAVYARLRAEGAFFDGDDDQLDENGPKAGQTEANTR